MAVRRPAISDELRRQYEAYPYPERNPADEAKRLIIGSPSHILEIDHYVFGGARDWAKPFRALIAGGGTGDAAIMLAQQLADARCPAEVIHLDVSEAAQEIARARAAARGLANIRFVNGSLLELDRLGLGGFDYVDCCGVLHHLADPGAGIAALVRALGPLGGIGAMVYAPYGRTGVYPVQSLLRMLTAGDPPVERLRLGRVAVAKLPPTNWLTRNTFVSDHRNQGDAGFTDLLLNPIDRPFTVRDVATLARGAGLRLTGLIEPLRYRPESYIDDPEILARLARLDPLAQAEFAELWTGNMRVHIFYAVRADNPARLPPTPDDAGAVPVAREIDAAALTRGLAAGQAMKVDFDGLPVRIALPPFAGAIVGLIDGRRSIGAIHAALAAGLRPSPDWVTFRSVFDSLYAALNGINRLYLRRPPESGAS